MNQSRYTARATVEKVRGVHRRATLETGTVIELGVHGPIKRHYQLSDAKDLPLPVGVCCSADIEEVEP